MKGASPNLMKCTYHIYRHKKPCRHVRNCFREGRFLYNVLVPLKYYSIPIQLSTSTSTTSTSAGSNSTSTTSTSAPAAVPAPAPAPAAPARTSTSTSASASTSTSTSSTSTTKMSSLLQFRASHTHDLTKGFIRHRQDRNFTTVSRDRRTILRKGSSGSGKIAILLQFRAIDTHDLTKPKGSNLALLLLKVISESAFGIKSAFDSKSDIGKRF